MDHFLDIYPMDCISDAVWEQYALRKLPEPALAKLEAHCRNCEICSDIKEGIDLMAHPAGLPGRVALLKQRARQYNKPVKKLPVYWLASAAALFLIAVSLSWLFFTNRQPQTTRDNDLQQVIPAPEIKPAPQPDITVPDNAPAKKDSEAVWSHVASPSVMKDQTPVIAQHTEVAENKDGHPLKEDTDFTESATGEDSGELKDNGNTEQKKNLGIVYQWDFGVPGSSDDQNREESEPNRDQPSNLRKPSGKKPSSMNQSRPMEYNKKETGRTETALYESAKQYYINKNYDVCIQMLEPLIRRRSAAYFESAILLKCKALIALKQYKSAHTGLDFIIQFGGVMKTEALQLKAETPLE